MTRYRLEHPNKDQLEDVFTFMVRCDIAEFGEPDSSREDLEELWNEITLETDAWLERDSDGNIQGYACVSGAGEGLQQDIYVNLALSPTGLEDRLMEACLQRAIEMVKGGLGKTKPLTRGYATQTNQRLQRVYEDFAFYRHTVHYQMQIDLDDSISEPSWPEGFSLAPYDPADELELYELIESVFTWAGRTPNPIDNWRGLVFRGGRYDPQLFLMLREGSRLVGAALSYDEGDHGWVRQLAIHRDYQGKGLGGLLLRQIFSIYNSRGARRVGLGVASANTNACAFYERAGMYRHREYIEYRKNLVAV